jgi:hypothetical protein
VPQGSNLQPPLVYDCAGMNADEDLSEEEMNVQPRPELLDEEGLMLFPLDNLEEEIQKKREKWHTFKTP